MRLCGFGLCTGPLHVLETRQEWKQTTEGATVVSAAEIGDAMGSEATK